MPSIFIAGIPTQAPPPSAATTAPTSPAHCNGVPTTGWSCCTTSNPCDVGGGDCDSDSSCVAGLHCGRDNCKRDYSSAGSNWADSADCCEGMLNIEI